MSTDPRAGLLSTHADVASGALRNALGGVHNGHLIYIDSRGRKLMAGYTGLATYGDNEAGGWRLVSLASYQTIMKPADESFNRMMIILLAREDAQRHCHDRSRGAEPPAKKRGKGRRPLFTGHNRSTDAGRGRYVAGPGNQNRPDNLRPRLILLASFGKRISLEELRISGFTGY